MCSRRVRASRELSLRVALRGERWGVATCIQTPPFLRLTRRAPDRPAARLTTLVDRLPSLCWCSIAPMNACGSPPAYERAGAIIRDAPPPRT